MPAAVFRRPVVVVAEDDTDLRELITTFLDEEGFRVVACGSGFEAVAGCARGPRVDVLVLDWVLPDCDGPALIRMVHAQRDLAQLPVVLTTGVDVALPGVEGAVCLLRKPFSCEELLRLLNGLTGQARQLGTGAAA